MFSSIFYSADKKISRKSIFTRVRFIKTSHVKINLSNCVRKIKFLSSSALKYRQYLIKRFIKVTKEYTYWVPNFVLKYWNMESRQSKTRIGLSDIDSKALHDWLTVTPDWQNTQYQPMAWLFVFWHQASKFLPFTCAPSNLTWSLTVIATRFCGPEQTTNLSWSFQTFFIGYGTKEMQGLYCALYVQVKNFHAPLFFRLV